MLTFRNYITLSILFISIQGCKQENTPLFSLKKEVVEIPFKYDRDGHILAKVIVGKDTMNFIVDTGSSITYLPYSNDLKKLHTSRKIRDAMGTIKEVSMVMVKDVKWGNLQIQNLSCGINQKNEEYGIIGGDILRNFCVQINNVKSKIILSKNVPVIEGKRIIKIPFRLDERNCVEILGILEAETSKDEQKKEYSFLFDTGCTDEVMFQGKESLPPVRELQQWTRSYSLGFSEKTALINASLFLANFRLKDCLFQNIAGLISHKINSVNMIGTVFIRRFESITIDYKNKMLYFKLPKDGKILKFPPNHITNAPTAHFALLCKGLASFGINFRGINPCIVKGIRKDWKDSIAINDTLVGINNTIFNKDAWEFTKKPSNKTLKDSLRFNQSPMIHAYRVIGDEVRFLFLKNKKIIAINAKRNTTLLPKRFAYSFSEKSEDWGYFGINTKKDSISNYSLHYPWSSLIQQKKEIIGYRNGKEIIMTNEFKF